MENAPSAQESLAIVDESRRAALQRSRSPWWYFPATGFVLGAATTFILLVQGVSSGVAIALMFISLSLLEVARVRVTGIRTSEFRRGGAMGYAVIILSLGLATLAAGSFLVFERGITWVAWATGAAIFVWTVVGGWIFERALLRSVKPNKA